MREVELEDKCRRIEKKEIICKIGKYKTEWNKGHSNRQRGENKIRIYKVSEGIFIDRNIGVSYQYE